MDIQGSEIDKAIMSINSKSAPGIDGMNSFFSKKFGTLLKLVFILIFPNFFLIVECIDP